MTPPEEALTVQFVCLMVKPVFARANVIEPAAPPDATLAVPAEDPVLVQVQMADWVHWIVTVAFPPPAAQSLSATGVPLDSPPAGVNARDDLP